LTRPSLQDATSGRVGAAAHDYALHNRDASTGNYDYRKDLKLSSAAAQLAGSHGRQGRILTCCVASAASVPADKRALNNTSEPDTALVGEMLFYNPDNISFPYHLQPKIGAWNKTSRIKNPESLLGGVKRESRKWNEVVGGSVS